MSMGSIDLQFALHKNDEAGIRQNQLSHKPQDDQALLGQQSVHSTEIQRQRSAMVDESSSTGVRDARKEKQQKQQSKGFKKVSSDANASNHAGKVDDPYKGHYIDFSL